MESDSVFVFPFVISPFPALMYIGIFFCSSSMSHFCVITQLI